MKMKCVFMHGPMDVRIGEREVEPLRGNEVRIKIERCGICGSDLGCYSGRTSEGRYDIAPYTPGHEYAGTIVEIGPNVQDFKVGDKVTGDCSMGCNACENCKNGKMPSACLHGDEVGFRPYTPGAMAEFLTLKEGNVHKLPNDWPFELGAWVETFCVGYFSVWGNGGYLDAAEDVLIVGAGSIGLCAAMTAKASGAHVIVADPLAFRREVILKYGADEALDPTAAEFNEQVLALTGGHGPSYVIEASGTPAGATTAIKAAADGGRVRLVGMCERDITIKPTDLIFKNLTVSGYNGTKNAMVRTIKFMDRIKDKYDFSALNTSFYPFTEAKAAFDFALENARSEIKVMLTFDAQ